MKSKLKKLAAPLLVAVMVLGAFGVNASTAQAASLTQLSNNMSRLKASTASNHDIRFVTPSGVQTTETITVTFSSDFVLGSVAFGDIDLSEKSDATCNNETGWTEETLVASGATSAQWNAAVAGNVVTFTSGGATATIATAVCVRVKVGTNAAGGTNQITNGAIDDDDTVTIAGTFGDTGAITMDIITDDQVVVTATVGANITFSISDNTIGYGSLNQAASRYATGDELGSAAEVEAHNLSASTNASSGYVIYMLGATLTSNANTITAIGGTNTAPAAGTEQFGVRFVESGTGTGTVTVPYAASGFAYDAISAQDEIASATGATDTSTYSAHYLANIDINTEAGAYATTLTYTATATF